MMKILSMAVNDEWIAKLDEIIDNLEYKISWVVNESRLFEQLQVAVQTIVFLPYTKSYDMYSLCAKISKTFPLATTTVSIPFRGRSRYEEGFKSRC